MENASDALIIAASIFLLIIALSVTISSFSNVKTQFDDIVVSYDKVQYAVNSDNGSLLNFIPADNYTRTVQIESIVTTLRRLRKENYDVYIMLKNPVDLSRLAKVLKSKINGTEKFGNITVGSNYSVVKFTLTGEANKYAEDKDSRKFDEAISLLYNRIGDSTFKEYYGLYQEKNEVSSVNKGYNKIVTYVQD